MLHNFGLLAAHYAPTMSTAWLHQTARDAALIMVPGISHLEALGNGGDLHMDLGCTPPRQTSDGTTGPARGRMRLGPRRAFRQRLTKPRFRRPLTKPRQRLTERAAGRATPKA